MPEQAVPEGTVWRELRPLLDRELSRLPDQYRSVIVLCDLEGSTRKEAARQLGAPEGSVSGWLARGQAMLAKLLARIRKSLGDIVSETRWDRTFDIVQPLLTLLMNVAWIFSFACTH